MTSSNVILLQFSINCFKIIFIYCICVHVLEYVVSRTQERTSP